MTLQEAIDKVFYEKPEKQRIIGEPNRRGWTDVWFTYCDETKKLLVNSWEYSHEGMYIRAKVAPFQVSEHKDWILV